MKPEQQRIAIAEACGPKLYMICKPIRSPFCYYRKDAKGYTNSKSEAWKVTAEEAAKHVTSKRYENEPDKVIAEPAPLPDYLNDLNAMQSAVMCQPTEFRRLFSTSLSYRLSETKKLFCELTAQDWADIFLQVKRG